jgi:glycosyltransferase involved in cell wall biosynthesis
MRPRHRWLARILAPRTACVVCNSLAVQRALAEAEGVPMERTRVVPNAVDLPPALPEEARARIRREHGAAPGETAVAQVATLTPAKDHALALAAAERLRARGCAFRWWFVGGGPLQSELEGAAAACGLSGTVRFLGHREDAREILAAADIAALTSRSEGFPNAVLEAMAAGRPVVATAVGGTDEAVVDGETGLLVPPADAEAFAEGLGRLAEDAALRERLGRAGRERAERLYGWDALTARMLSIYGEVLRRGRPGAPAAS